jgi:hypothetical protein
MRYELKKLTSNRFTMLLCVVLILANALLFWQSGTGEKFTQIAQKYESLDTLEAELEWLDKQTYAYFDGNVEVFDDNLVTGNIFDEYRLDQAVLARVREVRGYADFLRDLQRQAVVKANSGLFGAADSFAVRSILKSAAIYKPLETVTPIVSFTGGVESITTWRFSDIFALLLCLIAGIQLLTQERLEGYTALFRPTKNGHARLFAKKYAAMLLFVVLGLVLLQGSNFLIASATTGLGNLRIPVQSVYGMQSCPYAISVGEYLALFFGMKLLWLLVAASLIFLLCGLCRRAIYVLLSCAALTGLFAVMAGSTNLWLRVLSPVYLSDTNGLFNCCLLLNFFQTPIRLDYVALTLCAGLSPIFFIGALLHFCKHAIIPSSKRKLPTIALLPGRHVGLFRHECYKLLIVNRAALILLLLVLVQLFQYSNFSVNNSSAEHYYKQYSQTLSGYPSAQKDAYIAQEEARFAEINAKISEYAVRFNDNTGALNMATQDLRQELNPLEGFEMAKAQYLYLPDGAQYVYQTGYNRLYLEGTTDDLWNMLKLFFVLALTLSGIFAVEYETGVDVLQRTSGRAKAIRRRKIAITAIVMLLAMAIAFVPQYLAVAKSYGLPLHSARANSLPVFATLPDWMSLLHVHLLTNALRLLLAAAASAFILFLSRKTRSSFATLLISGATLLLPLLIAIFV